MMTETQYQQQFDRMMKRIESLYASKYQSIFKRTFNFASQIAAGGDPRESVNAVDRFSAELKQTLASNYNAAAVTFGSMVADQFGEEKSFVIEKKEKLSQAFWNSIDRWVNLQTAEKVTRINETTKNLIRGIIQAGLNDGESNSSIASMIKEAGGFSRARASLIATTETHNASTNATKTMVGEYKFKKEKRWMTAGDERVRESHANVSQEWIDEEEKFEVGGELLDIPGDPDGSARNVCRCRCAVMYRRKEGVAAQSVPVQTETMIAIDSKPISELQPIIKPKLTREEKDRMMVERTSAKFKKIKFTPARTVDEAVKFAKRLGVEVTPEFIGENLEGINLVNQRILLFKQKYGAVCGVSSVGNALQNLPFSSPTSPSYCATGNHGRKMFTHIAFKDFGKKTWMAEIEQMSRVQLDIGFWSSGGARAIVDHELGHSIDQSIRYRKELKSVKNRAIVRKEVTGAFREMLGVSQRLGYPAVSKYASSNEGEMVAEAFAEVFGRTRPRELSKKIVSIYDKRFF